MQVFKVKNKYREINVMMVLLNKQHESPDNPTLTAANTIIEQIEYLVYAFEVVYSPYLEIAKLLYLNNFALPQWRNTKIPLCPFHS